ncbi:esterase [Ramlibacter tataouinensis]|uniref:YqiA/YcfP family alpha/beta fold hydrolase n=1 Tax=Ramlibacter tataouinensis TaxID=94132 RepID=UPI0022F3BE52|nr:YqiA/YcfP family alpha/beta fold hydrolase [Ramlibacter tataouinensis]WBY00805.1 esterase [Ramlibacter tataouinensis]
MSADPVSVTHLLYLHGFRSSPRSAKAVLMAERIARDHPEVTWWCPQLPPSPRAAMEMVMDGIAAWPRERMGVIGSSLGGFYATHLAAVTGCRAVLLNPAVHAARDLAGYIGEQTAWHDPSQRFYFEPRYVDELRALEHGPLPHPGRVFAIVAKGDEVLDWREMTGRYPGSPIELIEGGDHAISDFDQRLGRVLAFLGLDHADG